MPKTDIKKIKSEDLAELSDEALDEARTEQTYICASNCITCGFHKLS